MQTAPPRLGDVPPNTTTFTADHVGRGRCLPDWTSCEIGDDDGKPFGALMALCGCGTNEEDNLLMMAGWGHTLSRSPELAQMVIPDLGEHWERDAENAPWRLVPTEDAAEEDEN